MIRRLKNYFRAWRNRGAARMNHGFWLHWAIFGRYPLSGGGAWVKVSGIELKDVEVIGSGPNRTQETVP